MLLRILLVAMFTMSHAATGTFDEGLGAEIEYRLYRPTLDSGKSAPLVVYLHANSENPMFSQPWFHEELQALEPSFLLLPHCLREGGYAADWGGTYDPDLRATLAEVLEVVDSLQQTHPIDRRRIYFYGGSMGAEAVFAVLAYRPGLAAAAVAVAGYTISDAPKAQAMARTPFWILHGGSDDLNPTSSSRNIFKAIRDAQGRKVRYTEYAGYGHNDIWGRVPQESSLVPWMLSQIHDSVQAGMGPGSVKNARISGDTLEWSKPTAGSAPWFYSIKLQDTLVAQVGSSDSMFVLGRTPAEGMELSISTTDMQFRESEPTRVVATSGVRQRDGLGNPSTWRLEREHLRVEWASPTPWTAELRTVSGQILSRSVGSGSVARLACRGVQGQFLLVLRQEGEPTQVRLVAIPGR